MIGIYISAFNRMDKISKYCPQVNDIISKYNQKYGRIFKLYLIDNASSDALPSEVQRLVDHGDIAYVKHSVNIGILGNLSYIANSVTEEYFWILGDDDVPTWQGLHEIAKAVQTNVDLIYLNFRPRGKFFNYRSFYFDTLSDKILNVSEVYPVNKMFFTAIYILVFKADFGKSTYEYYPGETYFSSLRNTIPTSEYILRFGAEKKALFLSSDCVEVGIDVTWGSNASDWTLIKIPELYELITDNYVSNEKMNYWKFEHVAAILKDLPSVTHLADKYDLLEIIDRLDRVFGPQLLKYCGRSSKSLLNSKK